MKNNREKDRPPSPCIKICQMDEHSGLCIGCLRTLPEIANWLLMTPVEKEEIYQKIEERSREKNCG